MTLPEFRARKDTILYSIGVKLASSQILCTSAFFLVGKRTGMIHIRRSGSDNTGKGRTQIMGDSPQEICPHFFFVCLCQFFLFSARALDCFFKCEVVALVRNDNASMAINVTGQPDKLKFSYGQVNKKLIHSADKPAEQRPQRYLSVQRAMSGRARIYINAILILFSGNARKNKKEIKVAVPIIKTVKIALWRFR